MSQGWVTNHRKIEDWEWYTVPHMAHLFQHLIRHANHEKKKWRGIEVQRGQLITSLQSLNTQTGISTRSLRTCLERLVDTKEIAQKTTNNYRLITICNYKTYQDTNHEADKRPTNDRQTTDKPTDKPPTTNNNVNKGNNANKQLYTDFHAFWNEQKHLPPIRTMTKDRKAKLAVRMNEEEFAVNWKVIIEQIALIPFLTGDNDRGWKANIDWILKNSTNYIKVLEGKYTKQQTSSNDDVVARTIAKMKAAGEVE